MPDDTIEKKQAKRLAFIADRLAVLMVIVKSRHDGWEWFYGNHMWNDEEGIAEELRDWPDYKTAKEIIRLWVQKFDKEEQENDREQRSSTTGERGSGGESGSDDLTQ